MVEIAIEYPAAVNFWKKYFLFPDQQLHEKVEWEDFMRALVTELKIPYDATYFANLEQLCQPSKDITMGRFDKFVKWFGHFHDPVHGPAIIAQINRLFQASWFHGDIPSHAASQRLGAHPGPGTFLVRLSSSDPKLAPFTLSVTGDVHIRIERIEGGFKMLDGKYKDLFEIVERNPHMLTTPCPKDYNLQYRNSDTFPSGALTGSGERK